MGDENDEIDLSNIDFSTLELKEHTKEKQKEEKKTTTTKKVMFVVLCVALIDLQLTYLLAFLGRTEIAETLAVSIVTEIIAVFLGYCCKSFFETKESEKNKITWSQLNNSTSSEDEEHDESISEEAVG